MTDQTEALRLAEWLDSAYEGESLDAAAELRRLHAVNQELLEALKDALFHVANQGDVGVDQWLVCERNVRAVITRAEEQK
jgi:hypothetical protein